MIYVFNTYEDLSWYTAETIYTTGQKAVKQRNGFHLVLSGGKTPENIHLKLADKFWTDREFWQHTHIYWGDERCVPSDDSQSNYYMTYLSLLSRVPVILNHIHRIQTELPGPEDTVRQYEALFPKNPDLVLLGIGTDGHTASLFPGSPVLGITDQYFAQAESPVGPQQRITMTPPAIGAARKVIVMASGKNKAEPLERVFRKEGSISETPARLVRSRTWFVDKDAAEKILQMKELRKNIRFHDK